MCRLLGVTRSLVYYHLNKEKDVKLDEDEKLIEEIKEIFRRSRNNYGTRKIKKELGKIGYKNRPNNEEKWPSLKLYSSTI